MRFFMGLVLVLALAAMGCSETSGTGGTAGGGGTGGTGGDGGSGGDAATFSYSVITSSTGDAADLLEELRTSTLPTLEAGGAVVYALWGPAPQQDERFPEIAEDKVVVMLSWAQVDAEFLTMELEALVGANQVETSLWEASLRGAVPLSTGSGFYIHSFELYRTEDVDEALSLSESAWTTFEPEFGVQVAGVWRKLEEEDGLTWTVRIAWYEDLAHWEESRDFSRDPESFAKFVERAALQEDQESWSAGLVER